MASRERRQTPWQTENRYYCAACNVWMGNDRQSIMLHENGKKHRENVERAMQERRKNKERVEKAQKFLTDSLKQMEQAALAGTGGNSGAATTSTHTRPQSSTFAQSNQRYQNYPPPPPRDRNHNQPPSQRSNTTSLLQQVPFPVHTQARNNQILPPPNSSGSQLQQERIDWQAQKLKREEINTNKRKNRGGDDDEDEEQGETSNKRSKFVIRPGEGYYSYDDTDQNGGTSDVLEEKITTTFLEGNIFFGLLEVEMPIQLWIGPSCDRVEKQQSKNARNWKNALVIKVTAHRHETNKDDSGELQQPTVHVSYMLSQDDEDESIEKNVSLDRIRIILGGDEKIPDTLEEARLLAMGGEEIQVTNDSKGNETVNKKQEEINEATGLSGWSTVSIKKTSHRQQHREEKKRFDESKREASKKREEEQRRIAERRLEESRVSNADDSALGAYDVWGKMDYKGVDISQDVHYSVEDSAKRLAAEKPTTETKVVFKKRVKKKGQKAGRRKTSSEDD